MASLEVLEDDEDEEEGLFDTATAEVEEPDEDWTELVELLCSAGGRA